MNGFRVTITAAVGAATAATFAAVGLGACSDSVDHTTTPDAGGGDSGAGADTGSAGTVTQTGQIIQLGSTSTGVGGAKIDPGIAPAVTADGQGHYSLVVPPNVPFFMSISADSYTTVLEQEWMVSGDFNRQTTNLPDSTTTQTLLVALDNLDKSKGVLSVGLYKVGACTDEGGATIALDPPGNSKVTYFENTFPKSSAMATVTGQNTPSAVIYNLEPGDNFSIKVTHPTCTQVPFPYTPTASTGGAPGDDPTITYTGKVRVDAAEPAGAPTPKTSFMRIFITK